MSKALSRLKPAVGADEDYRIFVIRKQKVMLSTHLAGLYHVEPRVLMQAVKRNLDRFPRDFMFQLTEAEWRNLKSQFVISSLAHGGLRRALPYCFTQPGVAMLSSVLNSPLAVHVNIGIMRAFVRLSGEELNRIELAKRVATLEQRYDQQDADIQSIFESIRQLIIGTEKKPRRIGF